MSDLLAEVDEAMRQERIEKFWKENKNAIIAAVVFVILATAAISGYRTWDAKVKTADTQTLTNLMEQPNFPQNINGEKLDIRPGLKGIALLTAAGQYIAEDKPEEALVLYKRAAEDSSIPDDLRQAAVLAQTKISGTEVPDEALSALKTVWEDDDSPWRYHARIEAAVILAHAKQDYAAARDHLDIVMTAQALPDSLYAKAKALDHVYALKQDQNKNAETPENAS